MTAARRRGLADYAKRTGTRQFAHPAAQRFPIPSRGAARAIGISEGQRQRVLRNAAARSAQRHTAGTHRHVAPLARARSGPGAGWNASHLATRAGRRTATRRSTPATRARVRGTVRRRR
jgi:hypothetical protein